MKLKIGTVCRIADLTFSGSTIDLSDTADSLKGLYIQEELAGNGVVSAPDSNLSNETIAVNYDQNIQPFRVTSQSTQSTNSHYTHIPQHFAKPINAFYQEVFNPWLNLHRPCLYATEITTVKGKIVKCYKHKDVKTPLACLTRLNDKGLVVALDEVLIELAQQGGFARAGGAGQNQQVRRAVAVRK